MRTFAWQGTQPVFSEREITNSSPYILVTVDDAYVTFSRNRSCTNPYDLTFDFDNAHKFATIEKAITVMLELKKLGENCSILSI